MMLESISLLDWSWLLLLLGFVWAPRTWSPGELVSAAAMNTNIRDHLNEGLRTQATALTGNQDDFALDGPFTDLKCNNASALVIRGALIDSGNVDGARIIVEAHNSTVTFKDQDAGSATANRIITPDAADLVLAAFGRALMVYDGTATRWRVSRISYSDSVLCELAGNIGMGTATPATSAKLEISTTTGAALLSRLTEAQRDALTAVNGMLLYNSDRETLQGYVNSAWNELQAGINRITDQSINNVAWTAVDFVNAIGERSAWSDVGNNHILPTTAGHYLICGHIIWANNDANWRQARFDAGGGAVIPGNVQRYPAKTLSPQMFVTTGYFDGNDDTVGMSVYQDSGGALNLTDAYLWVIKAGLG